MKGHCVEFNTDIIYSPLQSFVIIARKSLDFNIKIKCKFPDTHIQAHMISVCVFMRACVPFPFQGDKIIVQEYIFENDRKETYLDNYEATKYNLRFNLF